MKKFIVHLLPVCLFVMSCTVDEAVSSETENTVRTGTKLKSLTGIANPDNDYDYVGALHVEILNDYLENSPSSATIRDIIDDVEDIAGGTRDFSLISDGYPGLTVTEVALAIEDTSLPGNLIDNSAMSAAGKIELTDFLDLVDNFDSKPLSYVYDTVTNFEEEIMGNSTLTGPDIKIILTTTATARYSIAYANDKDRQWSKTRTGIICSINNSAAKAVITSVTANIIAD